MVYIQLAAGLALLIAGGEILIRGAVAISTRLGIPPLVVGLTIVALGTSAPELTVSLDAAFKGVTDIVTGGVVGSNIANILLVLGAAAIVTPISATRKLVRRDGMVLIAATLLLCGLALAGIVPQAVAALMVLCFAAYTAFSYIAERGRGGRSADDTAGEPAPEPASAHGGLPPRLRLAVPVFLAGLAGIVFGADMLVDSAVRIARMFGVSEAVIGLSLIAIGTSLPELVIAVIGAIRGHSDVALGNVVGSNISNILVILGATGFIIPIPIGGQIAQYDIWIMLAATIVLLPVLVSGWRLSRTEAVLFLGAYAAYIYSIYAGFPARLIGALGIT